MHVYDVERGNLGANGVVGGGLRDRRRRARIKMRDEARVAVAFFGDGATNIGTLHEALNLAQLWSGALRVREQPLGRVDAREPAARRTRPRMPARRYGMDSVRHYGRTRMTVRRGRPRGRAGQGTSFFLCDT